MIFTQDYFIYLLGYLCFFIILGSLLFVVMYYLILIGMMISDYKDFSKWRIDNDVPIMPINILDINKQDKSFTCTVSPKGYGKAQFEKENEKKRKCEK